MSSSPRPSARRCRASSTDNREGGATAQVFTIGYQGSDPARLVETLREAGVATLIDVRALAWSRRPEFVGRALAERLTDAGLEYRHLPALGNPEKGRQAAKSGESYQAIYEAHLDSPPAQQALDTLSGIPGPICLMCMERDPAQCHRSLLGLRLQRDWGIEVQHLNVATAQMSLF